MLFRSLFIFCLAIIPTTLASAASQFHLNVNKDVSQCWNTCHGEVVYNLPMPGATGFNSPDYIGANCALDEYAQYMSLCLPVLCPSAPDVAYAYEYGKSWCKKAGYDIKLQLSGDYLSSPAGAFFNSTQVSSASRLVAISSSLFVVLVGAALLAL